MLVKLSTLFFLLTFTLLADTTIKDSIVKIYTVSKIPNYVLPWNTKISRSHGSGSIISGNRILTNAHVVADETFIEVKRYGKTERYEAYVEYISHQADLAILRVKDTTFFKGAKPLQFGKLPKIQQKVTVYGFPMGGSSLSVSTGIVSRIEHNNYAHSGESFLSIQIDAAVNPGNSGGPALSNGRVVGVVMQQIKKSQNLGYLVPTEVVEHFLRDIKDGHYDGFANLGIGTQNMQNEALRSVYGMDKERSGILINNICETSNANKKLKVGDVLLSIDGHKVENDRSVEFAPKQFTSYAYYIDQKQMGESIKLKLLRDGKFINVEVKLQNIADEDLLVKTREHDKMPRYFIYGGYVFTPLTRNLMRSSRSLPLDLRVAAGKWRTKEQKELVVLLRVLADKSNRGNHGAAMWQVESINGKTFKDFDTFKKILKSEKSDYVILNGKDKEQLAIQREDAIASQKRILSRYSIKTLESQE